MENERRLPVPCDCIGSCTMMLVAEYDGEWTFDFYSHIRCQPRRWRRVRAAWGVLRGREPWTHGIVLDRGNAERLGRWLIEQADV